MGPHSGGPQTPLNPSGSAALDDFACLHVDLVAPRSYPLHRLEAVLHHVAIKLDAIAVGIGEIDAARDVVLDGGLDLDPHRLELAIRGLQLFEAAELPRRVMQAGLLSIGLLVACRLEQRQLVVLLAEAQEDAASLRAARAWWRRAGSRASCGRRSRPSAPGRRGCR